MILEEVAAGVWRGGSDQVNWYVIDDGRRLTVIDAGFPAHAEQLTDGLRERDRTLGDVVAVVLTHAHADHIGFAEWLQSELGVAVLVHAGDAAMARTGERPPAERPFEAYLANAAMRRFMAEMSDAGGMAAPLVAQPTTFTDGDELDVPGRPQVIHTPGHSPGQCRAAIRRPRRAHRRRRAVHLNVATGATGPQIAAGAFNVSSEQALRALDRIAALPEPILLFGHGEPWPDGAASAVAAARATGTS